MERAISTRDTSATGSLAVVNQDFVKKLFDPGENPIGHRLYNATYLSVNGYYSARKA